MADDSGSGMSGISSSISVEYDGLRGHERKTAVCGLGEAVERASCWLETLAGSMEERGSDLASHCQPANQRVLWLRVETLNDGVHLMTSPAVQGFIR